MGEDKWTQREPGSVTGSVVPPPVAPEGAPEDSSQDAPDHATDVRDEPSPIRQPLPRRKPKASGHQRAADQRRLRIADQPAPASPQLPDNVRYLFKPVLTQDALAAEPAAARPAAAAAQPAEVKPALAETQPGADERTGELGAARRTSAGSAGAPAADRQVKRQNRVATPGTHRRGGAAGAGGKPRRRITLAAMLVVASTAVGTAFALVRSGSSATPSSHKDAGTHYSTRGGRTGPNGLRGLSSAAIVRAQAARWVASQIGKSAIVACDDVMCTQLFNEGLAASNLLVLSPTAPSPLGADVVIGTPALRSQFGQRLAWEYAPTVIASFGTGKTRVDVRVVAPDGAAAYERALSRDLAARQSYGSVLLRNSRISVSVSAQPDLIAGLVDPRLLMMLPVLASQHPIQILGFYDRAPRAARGVPLSGTELAGYDAAAGLPGGSYLRWLLVFLRGQRAPYWPTSVVAARVNGREIVRVQFSRPSPIGLLNGQ